MHEPRVNRDFGEMVEQLDTQLNLLEDHCNRAFSEGREEYLGEIAVKLRLLVVRSRHNMPLLFNVAERLGVAPTVVLPEGPPVAPPAGEPGPGERITLDCYLGLGMVWIRTSVGLMRLTHRQLIRKWCEQLGGAHEDWAIDEDRHNAVRDHLILLNGRHPAATTLAGCARTVLIHGRRLVQFARDKAAAGSTKI